MSLFTKKSSREETSAASAPAVPPADTFALFALGNVRDAVIVTSREGIIKYLNPAALTLTGAGSSADAVGLDYGLLLKLATLDGRALPESENMLFHAMRMGQSLEDYNIGLASIPGKNLPISLSMIITDTGDRVIVFRSIKNELAEDSDKTDFISTASHEMRTPVASIEGYLSLALSPKTATIDERARGYLTAAHNAATHLGKLFRDLLDVTKLDDGHIRPHYEPVEMVSLIKTLMESYSAAAKAKPLNFQFGSPRSASFSEVRRVEQVVYGYVDVDFMRLILGNLIENAIKYTPAGGSIYVNVEGEGERLVISVADTGIGINAADLPHIFQRFYRVDNSDTRTIGGTGLGLYLVKQRTEAMGGSVSAESSPGAGSKFYVYLPRISSEEYEKRMIAVNNNLGGQQ